MTLLHILYMCTGQVKTVFPNASLKNIYGMTETGAIAKSDTLGKSLPLTDFNKLTYTPVFGNLCGQRICLIEWPTVLCLSSGPSLCRHFVAEQFSRIFPPAAMSKDSWRPEDHVGTPLDGVLVSIVDPRNGLLFHRSELMIKTWIWRSRVKVPLMNYKLSGGSPLLAPTLVHNFHSRREQWKCSSDRRLGCFLHRLIFWPENLA